MASLPRTFGPFLLLKSLGSGASGDVFIARPLDPRSGWPTPLVVKRMHSVLTTQPELQARFQHEARIALALSTPHVPRIHVAGEAEGTSFIAMDFVAGWTLSRVMRGKRHRHRPEVVPSLIDIIKQVLTGLIALHEAKDPETGLPLGALHRDLAPKNIMLGRDGVARLIDLGLGKSTVQQWQTTMGVVMGTPGYMAPEQVMADATDVRTDLYTTGIVLWELLAGEAFIARAPIAAMLRAQAQAEYRPLPQGAALPAVEPILQKALSLEPAARFDSARTFLAELTAATSSLPAGRPVGDLVTPVMWEELNADQDEVMDLTQALAVPVIPQELSRPPDEPDDEDHSGATERGEIPPFALEPTEVFSPVQASTAAGEPVHEPKREPSPAPRPSHGLSRQPSLPPEPALVPPSEPEPSMAPTELQPTVRPPPEPRSQTVLVLLAIAAVGTLLGIGSFIVYAYFSEQPAPAVPRSGPPIIEADVSPKVDTPRDAEDRSRQRPND